MKTRLVAALAAILLSLQPVGAYAQVQAGDPATGDRATAMVLDLVVVRPFSLVGSVVGLAAFLVSLPFTAPTGSAPDAANTLVGGPLEYTFNRPLGDFHHCGVDRHPCGSW